MKTLIKLLLVVVLASGLAACKSEPKEELLDYTGEFSIYNKTLGGVVGKFVVENGKGSYYHDSDDGLVGNVTANEVDKHFAHYIILEKGNIEVKVRKDSALIFGGTPSNIEIGKLDIEKEPYRLGIKKLQIKEYGDIGPAALTQEKEKDLKTIRELAKKWSGAEMKFALDRDDLAGIAFLRRRMSSFSKDELNQLVDQYSKHADHEVYQSLLRYKEAEEKTGLGVVPPDFNIKDDAGKSHQLSNRKGKVVLLDFWASWCIPCRKEIPHLKELNKAYASEGLDIVSISIDDDKEKWLKAVKEERMPWDQLWDEADDVSKAYYVKSIPKLFLLDKDGTVIGRNLRGKKLTDKLAEVFGESPGKTVH